METLLLDLGFDFFVLKIGHRGLGVQDLHGALAVDCPAFLL